MTKKKLNSISHPIRFHRGVTSDACLLHFAMTQGAIWGNHGYRQNVVFTTWFIVNLSDSGTNRHKEETSSFSANEFS